MSQPHNEQEESKPTPSQNVFVRFQQAFERGFNGFRDRYGALLERDHRPSAHLCHHLARTRASFPVTLFSWGVTIFRRSAQGPSDAYAGAARDTVEVSGRIATLVSNSIEELLPVRLKTS